MAHNTFAGMRTASAACVLALFLADGVAAQQAAAPGPVPGQLEEIVVTARRREEALQTTPVSVTAFSAGMLDRLNVQEVRDVAAFAPNLSIDEQPASSTAGSAHIRGIGESNTVMTAEPGVGLYLDGVYIARTVGQVFDLVDLERMEVLRGPQGTLFGRNTIGGAIQLVSKRPADAFGLEEKAGYGSFDEWYSKTTVNTGWIAGLPVKASLSFLHRQRDGYVDNTLTSDSDDPGATVANSVWASLHADLWDEVQVDYSFDFNHRRVVPTFFQLVTATPDVRSYFSRSPSFGGAPFQLSPTRLDSAQRALFGGRNTSIEETLGHNLTLNWKASDTLTVKSIAAYRSYTSDEFLGNSGNGPLRGVVLNPVTFAPSTGPVVPFEGFQQPHDQYQVSEELQLLFQSGRWSGVAGFYYFFEHVAETLDQSITFVLPGGEAGLNLFPVSSYFGTSESVAAFGQVSYRPPVLDDRLEVTGGLRATRDSKYINISDSSGGVPTFSGTGNRSFNNLSWLVSLNYQATKDLMGYARVSTGYRAGGFNPRAGSAVNSFGPEKLISYELGVKSEWFDKRLRANAALFYSTYKDLQSVQFVAGSGGASTQVVNAGKAVMKGYELEVAAVPFEGLTLDGSLGFTLPTYKTFPFRDPATNQLLDLADEAFFTGMSKLTSHVGVQYSLPPTPVGVLSARVDFTYHSQRRFHPLNRSTQFNDQVKDPGQRNWDARLTLADIPLGFGDAGGEISVWGRNLTNEDHVVWGIDFGALGYGGRLYGIPRSFGVDVKLSY